MDDDDRPDEVETDLVENDDLDISHDERVATLGSGRYVITTGDGDPPDVDDSDVDAPAESAGDASSTHAADDEADGRAGADDAGDDVVLPRDPRRRAVLARKLLAERVGAVRADHAVSVTALVDGSVRQHEVVSDDVTDVFRSVVTWYADAVSGSDTPTDEVLGILLLASAVQVTYPSRAVDTLADAHGLDRTDSIGDLVAATAESGASFPPERRT